MDAHASAAITAFVGRDDEQAAVRAVIERSVAGSAGALLIAGDAGVGKTALVEQVCSRLDPRVVVLTGSSLPLSAMTVPFLALRSALRSSDSALAAPVSMLEEGDRLSRVPFAFDRWLSEVCDKRPVVLAIDDLHWADQSTLDVLMYVLAGPAERPLSVIATVRRGEVGADHPLQQWLANVRRLPRVDELCLDPLNRMGTSEHLAGLMGTPVHQSLVDDVFARTCGNAYLIQLLAKGLEPDARTVPANLPADLSAAVLQSWRALPEWARELTQILATGGGPLSVGDLVAVSALKIDPGDAGRFLRQAIDAGVLDMAGDGRLWFHHPVIAEVLERNLTYDERVRWHGAFAKRAEQLIEDNTSATPELMVAAADHHDRAGHVWDAYRWALRAADAAGSTGGTAEELRLLRRAITLRTRLPYAGESERYLLQRVVSAAKSAAAHREELEATQALLAVLDTATEPLIVAELLVRRANLRFLTGRGFDLRSDFQKAIEISATDPASWQHAYALAGLGEYVAWHSDPQAETLTDRALKVAREAGNSLALSFALSGRAAVLCLRGEYAECTRLAAEAVAVAVEAQDFYAYFCGTIWELNAQMSRHVATTHAARRREQWAALDPPAAELAVLSAFEADGWFTLGDWRTCQERLRDALGSHPGPLADVNARLTAARLAAWQGRSAEARGHLARANELYRDGSSYLPLCFDVTRATVALASGDPEGAIAAALVGAASPDPPHMGGWLVPLAARALADLVDSDRAAGRDMDKNIRRLDDLTEQFASACFWDESQPDPGDLFAPALEDLYRAEVGRGRQLPENGEQWVRATQSCHTATMPWEEAYAAWRTAESLLSRGPTRADHFASTLRRALALADELGAEPIRREIMALATSARIRIDGVGDRAADDIAELPGLTSREREILPYIVAGRTYREIARALHISEKTVSSHISNLLRKTGTRNRIDLARLASRSTYAPTI
ncbi:MAG: AAA family ATPase [Ornithinimicrobium sp.]